MVLVLVQKGRDWNRFSRSRASFVSLMYFMYNISFVDSGLKCKKSKCRDKPAVYYKRNFYSFSVFTQFCVGFTQKGFCVSCTACFHQFLSGPNPYLIMLCLRCYFDHPIRVTEIDRPFARWWHVVFWHCGNNDSNVAPIQTPQPQRCWDSH